jgi:hypothetical protein
MLKLTEIVEKALEYDSEIEACKTSTSLREIYLNPDYIISIKEDVSLSRRSSVQSLITDVDENISFSELVVRGPGTMTQTINVIGSPRDVAEKYYKLLS